MACQGRRREKVIKQTAWIWFGNALKRKENVGCVKRIHIKKKLSKESPSVLQ